MVGRVQAVTQALQQIAQMQALVDKHIVQVMLCNKDGQAIGMKFIPCVCVGNASP